MFTGIIEQTGIIKSIEANAFTFGHSFKEPLEIGESVAVNGMCVTVTKKSADFFSADIIKESRDRTVFSDVKVGNIINLERSAKVGDQNSGHHVSGHIDETGKITKLEQKSDFWLLRIAFSAENFPLVILKGSVAINGISLTVSAVSNDQKNTWLEVSIIPHTWGNTDLKNKAVGDLVNLEFDQAGKYLLRGQSKKSAKKVILKTERLTLRPYTLEDAHEVFKIATKHPDMTKYMCWNPPKKLEETLENYYQGLCSTDGYGFGIEYQGQFIGRIHLRGIQQKTGVADLSVGDLGYWLHPEYHNQGFMTEVIKEIVRFGFEDLNLRRITGAAFVENLASQKVLQKAGAQKIGIEKNKFYKNGQLYDECLYEFVNENWQPHE